MNREKCIRTYYFRKLLSQQEMPEISAGIGRPAMKSQA